MNGSDFAGAIAAYIAFRLLGLILFCVGVGILVGWLFF